MKGNGLMIRDVDKAIKHIKMETFIEEYLWIIKLMEKEHILGLMVKFMMENGCKALKMDLEFLKVLKMIHI
jgi:hypothetical protein